MNVYSATMSFIRTAFTALLMITVFSLADLKEIGYRSETASVSGEASVPIPYYAFKAPIQNSIKRKFVETKIVPIQSSGLECGVRIQSRATRTRRIVGGEIAPPGAWPWYVALYMDGYLICGATLISSQWLISAGHCFYQQNQSYFVARLGDFHEELNSPSPDEQVRNISHTFIHPEYEPNYVSEAINDIVILRMVEPVRFTIYIQPICLPSPLAVLREGRICTVVGRGKLYENQVSVGSRTRHLQQLQVPIYSKEECRKRYNMSPVDSISKNKFCAGSDQDGRGTCQGDSGGPFMCEELNGRWTLQGVTSQAGGCAKANYPTVYVKVANYLTWIDQVVNGTY